MRYLVLATDYDGTLAFEGSVRPETFTSLDRLRDSGRRVILVTGRELDDLETVCPRLDVFDRVIAENGALLYRPETREEVVLAEPPPPELAERLRAMDVPISAGRVIVAMREPHQIAALEVIRDLGLELQVIFNKGAVMLLPSGVNKETGLRCALRELGLSERNTVAVGDAENDHAMLAASECGVAVANALDALKERADFVTRGARGEGVEELIDLMVKDDLRSVVVARHALLLGKRRDGTEVHIAPSGRRVLVAGASCRAAVGGFVDRIMGAGYQICVLDPQGHCEGLGDLAAIGNAERPPSPEEIVELIQKPEFNIALNLTALPVGERASFFAALLPRLQEVRARTGRPHWLVIADADQLITPELTLPRDLGGVLMLSRRPERIGPSMIEAVDTVLAVGDSPETSLRPFGADGKMVRLDEGEVLSWSNGILEPLRLEASKPKQPRQPAHGHEPALVLT